VREERREEKRREEKREREREGSRCCNKADASTVEMNAAKAPHSLLSPFPPILCRQRGCDNYELN
jgi:hypothetical protein